MEHLRLLQRRLWSSLLGRLPGAPGDPNNDIYHEATCEDFGRREGFLKRIFFGTAVLKALHTAAGPEVMGCGMEIAWLTAIVGSLLRLFPACPCVRLILKCPCRDGFGE